MSVCFFFWIGWFKHLQLGGLYIYRIFLSIWRWSYYRTFWGQHVLLQWCNRKDHSWWIDPWECQIQVEEVLYSLGSLWNGSIFHVFAGFFVGSLQNPRIFKGHLMHWCMIDCQTTCFLKWKFWSISVSRAKMIKSPQYYGFGMVWICMIYVHLHGEPQLVTSALNLVSYIVLLMVPFNADLWIIICSLRKYLIYVNHIWYRY